MIPVFVDYASPSALTANAAGATLGFSANARRPVRFHGRVARETFFLRVALRALGQAIWSDDTWQDKDSYLASLDPVITVHPDRLFFEAFTADQSAYVQLVVDPALFETEGEVRTGTTNVDFTAWLWGALGEMRSSRETWMRVDPGGFAVATTGAGGRFEAKVELPDEWVRGFLQTSAAMALPGTRLSVRPVDLLAAIRYLRFTKAKLSPRALRYEIGAGRDAQLVLEPWEKVIPLRGSDPGATEPRTIRTWGRRRLRLLEAVLPFAERVDVYLKGRAMPSFYAVKLPGMTFVLGLSSYTDAKLTDTASFDLLDGDSRPDEALVERVREALARRFHASVDGLATELGRPAPAIAAALQRLCRLGRAMYDVERRAFRHRELFEQPIDATTEARLYPPDLRVDEARALLQADRVRVADCSPRETRKVKTLPSPDGKITREVVYRDWQVEGAVGGEAQVEIVVNEHGAIIFGKCGCAFFQEHLLARGPCAHMLALHRASEPRRRDLPTSVAGPDALDDDGQGHDTDSL